MLGETVVQFSKTSDYAIRTVLYLALNQKRCCSAGEIQAAMGVPALYLNKITKRLKSAGILKAIQGHNGGYTLLKEPAQVSLYSILSLTEQSMEISGCLSDEAFCSRHASGTCPVRKAFMKINSSLMEELREATVQNLLEDAEALPVRGQDSNSN